MTPRQPLCVSATPRCMRWLASGALQSRKNPRTRSFVITRGEISKNLEIADGKGDCHAGVGRPRELVQRPRPYRWDGRRLVKSFDDRIERTFVHAAHAMKCPKRDSSRSNRSSPAAAADCRKSETPRQPTEINLPAGKRAENHLVRRNPPLVR